MDKLYSGTNFYVFTVFIYQSHGLYTSVQLYHILPCFISIPNWLIIMYNMQNISFFLKYLALNGLSEMHILYIIACAMIHPN